MANPSSPSNPGRQVKQLPAVVEVFSIDGTNFVLRLHDAAYQAIALGIVGKLPATAQTVLIVTPTATQLFSLGGAAEAEETETSTHARSQRRAAAPPELLPDGAEAPEDNGNANADEDPMDTVARLAEMDESEGGGGNDQRKPVKQTARARRRPPAEPNATCGRCNGTGKKVDGNTCPVCKGSGGIVKFGVGRR